MATLTFWYEFASTYTYPTAMRIDPLAEAAGVEVRWQPFLLGPIFKDQGWSTSPFNIYPNKGAYMWRDLERICSDLEIPFQRPDPFPQNGLLAARLATYGLSQGWGRAFSKAVYQAEFAEGRSIDEADLLADLVTRVGGDAETALQNATTEGTKLRLKVATQEAAARGLFGSPSFVCDDGEVFWGNDRLDDALGWAKREG